jgi:polysaccharide export outer membrane protein
MRIFFLLLFWANLCFANTFIDRDDINNDISQEINLDSPSAINPKNHTIKIGDLFEITVKQDKKINGKYRVGQDGQIDFPLIGKIHAESKTIDSLRQEITNNLERDFIRNPRVEIILKKSRLSFINLKGAFNIPGQHQIQDKVTIQNAIAIGGGAKKYADLNRLEIIRVNNNQNKKEFYAYKRIELGEVDGQELVAGDTVILHEALPILVEGAVINPGPVYGQSSNKLTEVINLAGGFTKNANTSSIKVLRLNADNVKTQTVYHFKEIVFGKIEEPTLEPGDEVFVGECQKKISLFGISLCMKNSP